MAWHLVAFDWLVHAALGGMLCLFAGCLAVRCCRQPVRRVRLIELTLFGSLLVPLAARVPWLPHWSAGVLPPSPPAGAAPAAAKTSAPDLVVERPLVTPLAFAAANDETKAAEGGAPAAVVAQTAVEGGVPVEPVGPPAAWSWPSAGAIVVAFYGLFAAGLALWTLYGLLVLLRLYRSALPVPRQVADLFRDMAGRAGERVRLVASDRIELPLTFT